MDIKDIEKEFGVKIDREKIKKAAKWKLEVKFWEGFLSSILTGAFFGGFLAVGAAQAGPGWAVATFFGVIFLVAGYWYISEGYPLALALSGIEDMKEGEKDIKEDGSGSVVEREKEVKKARKKSSIRIF